MQQLGEARDWSRHAAIPGATSFNPDLWNEPSHELGTTEDSFQGERMITARWCFTSRSHAQILVPFSDVEEEDDDELLGDDATGGFEFVGTLFQA